MRDASVMQGLESRQNTHYGISIDLPTIIVKAAKLRFIDAEWVQEIPNHLLLRDDNQISVYFYQLDEEAKDWVHAQMVESGHRTTANTISALREAEKDPNNILIPNLTVLAQAISAYISQDAIDGWIYAIGDDGESLPWLVTNVSLQEMSNGQECVVMNITANSVAMNNNDYSRPNDRYVFFFANESINSTVSTILTNKGFMKETPVLKRAYEDSLKTFVNFVPQISEQFIAKGTALEVDLSKQYHNPERLRLSGLSRVVNDEDLVKRKFLTKSESPFWKLQNRDYSNIPIHPMILC